MFVLVILLRSVVDTSPVIPARVLLIGIALTIAVGWIHRFFTQYAITTKRLHIRQGILSKTESSTNVDRIQNITVRQSPVDRIMRVGTEFETASDTPGDRFSSSGSRPAVAAERIMQARDAEKRVGSERSGGLA